MRISIKQIMLATAGIALILVVLLALSQEWRKKLELTNALKQYGAAWVESYSFNGEFSISTGFYGSPLGTIAPDSAIRSVEFKLFDVTPASFQQLRKLDSLDTLALISCDLVADDLSSLDKIPPVSTLVIWNASGLTDEAVESIARLRGLRQVSIKNTSLSKKGAAQLRALLPDAQVLVE